MSLNGFKKIFLTLIFTILATNGQSIAGTVSHPEVVSQIFDKVKKNNHWKLAFLTAKDAQIVFMNISPITNPKNDIGTETHRFDQIIFVIQGDGKAIIDGKTTKVIAGDLIFVPQGVAHNLVNLNAKKPLKILSVYSSTDIPANAHYQKKPNPSQD